jgi:hypothetical protein
MCPQIPHPGRCTPKARPGSPVAQLTAHRSADKRTVASRNAVEDALGTSEAYGFLAANLATGSARLRIDVHGQ